MAAGDERRRWGTPTGAPCPRSLAIDGSVVGEGDCHGCGFCLLIADLVDPPEPPPAQAIDWGP